MLIMIRSLCDKFASFEDTHRVKAPSNKTRALIKSIHMSIWVAGTSDQFF